MKCEIWLPVLGWEDLYEVSNTGKVRSLQYKGSSKLKIVKELKPYITKAKYLRVSLCRNNRKKYRFVHRLVAEAFLENPNNLPTVDHKDNNTMNAHLDNLQWVTASQNNKFSFERGRPPVKSWLGKSGATHNKSKKVVCVTLGVSFGSAHEAARELGMHQGDISQVCRGEKIHKDGLYFKYIQ